MDYDKNPTMARRIAYGLLFLASLTVAFFTLLFQLSRLMH